MKKTTKSRKRPPHDPNKVVAVKATAKKFEVTEAYVRLCVSGDAKTGQSDDIRKYYQTVYQRIQSVTA